MKRLLRVEHPVFGGKVERERPVLRAARKKRRLHQTDQAAGRPFLLAKHAIDPLHKGLLCFVLCPAKRSGVQRVKNLVIHTAHPLSRFSYSIIFLYRLASKTGRAARRRARFVCFGNFTAEFVGGDAHIAPLGIIEFALDFRKIGLYRRGDVLNRPLRKFGTFHPYEHPENSRRFRPYARPGKFTGQRTDGASRQLRLWSLRFAGGDRSYRRAGLPRRRPTERRAMLRPSPHSRL